MGRTTGCGAAGGIFCLATHRRVGPGDLPGSTTLSRRIAACPGLVPTGPAVVRAFIGAIDQSMGRNTRAAYRGRAQRRAVSVGIAAWTGRPGNEFRFAASYCTDRTGPSRLAQTQTKTTAQDVGNAWYPCPGSLRTVAGGLDGFHDSLLVVRPATDRSIGWRGAESISCGHASHC